MRTWGRFVAWSAVLAAAVVLAARPTGPLPPLGPLLDPVRGVWAVAYSAEHPDSFAAVVPGLGAEVRVAYDDRGVPHIFASAPADAYRALGYVAARDRLFQMELQTRATAGTLSELLGPSLLEADIQARRLGLSAAAEREFARVAASDPEVAEALNAYSDGVNAFIEGLSPAQRPFEYHLLGLAPFSWEPAHTLYLLKRMGWILAFSSAEWTKERVAARVGRDASDALFPVDAPIAEPIVPYQGARWLIPEIAPPGAPDAEGGDAGAQTDLLGFGMHDPSRSSVLGSNNWVIGPSRSSSGHAVLAGDPHLSLSLPSIWYEAHLVVPGHFDVYGVTLPGVPGIVIGFNRDVAWSFTNTGADVTDYYRERLDNDTVPTSYFLDGSWEPLESRIEHFFGPDGSLLASDTVYRTHRGPLLQIDGQPVSLRWTVLEGNAELGSLVGAARATSADEWLAAMSSWHAPAQNAVVAGRDGTIAVQSAGHFPLRPEGVRGDRIQDGTTRAVDWLGRTARFPIAVNPEQGYLASANQQPYDPAAEPAYLGVHWPEPWRALTINELLRGQTHHSATEMAAYQTHPYSVRARTFRALLLAAAERGRQQGQVAAEASRAADMLEEWDGAYTTDNERAVLFEAAMAKLRDALWDELEDGEGNRVATPGDEILWVLFGQPDSPWWDDTATAEVEKSDEIVARALAEALEDVRRRRGPEDDGGWAWHRITHHNIYHFLQLPALSRLRLPAQGGPGLLNPVSGTGTHGASWRMVVEMGDEVTARGTYPGGQRGNPASRGYDDRLRHWADGQLEDLRFPRTEEDLSAVGRLRSELVLLPASANRAGPDR